MTTADTFRSLQVELAKLEDDLAITVTRRVRAFEQVHGFAPDVSCEVIRHTSIAQADQLVGVRFDCTTRVRGAR